MLDFNYRVIEILDEYSILINYGRDEGAAEDDEVRIICTGPEVIDPLTGANIGTLDFIKANLTITTAYSKFSICKKIKTTISNPLLSPLSQFQSTSKTPRPLDIDKSKISNKKIPNNTTIEIGDLVEVL